MRRDTHESDQDFLDDQDRDDTLDSYDDDLYDKELYNAELARKAVGSLFDDESAQADGAEPDGGRYVTGFDKPARATKPRIRVADDRYDDEPRDSDYEDQDETAYAYRKRSVSKEPTPAPRPAVKVNAAHPAYRDSARGHSRVRPVVTRNMHDDSDDEYDTFRQHDKKYAAPPPAARKTETASRTRPERETYYENEPANPVRWVAAALTFIFLIILAFLVYRISVVSGELKAAQAIIESTPSNDTVITELRLTIEEQDHQILEKDDEIDRLKAELALYQSDSPQYTPSDITSGSAAEPGATQANTPSSGSATASAATVYTVVSGDNLSKISIKFYGSASLANITKIKEANNLTNDNISIGQKLTIPE